MIDLPMPHLSVCTFLKLVEMFVGICVIFLILLFGKSVDILADSKGLILSRVHSLLSGR